MYAREGEYTAAEEVFNITKSAFIDSLRKGCVLVVAVAVGRSAAEALLHPTITVNKAVFFSSLRFLFLPFSSLRSVCLSVCLFVCVCVSLSLSLARDCYTRRCCLCVWSSLSLQREIFF